MEKRREPFELVIHIDENGTRATASYRTRVFDDDGTSVIAQSVEGVTLAELGDDFPWKEFLNKTVQAALLKAEATDQLQADLDAEKSKVKAAEAEVEKHKATIANWQSVASVIAQNFVNGANLAANDVNKLIEAQKPKEEKAE